MEQNQIQSGDVPIEYTDFGLYGGNGGGGGNTIGSSYSSYKGGDGGDGGAGGAVSYTINAPVLSVTGAVTVQSGNRGKDGVVEGMNWAEGTTGTPGRGGAGGAVMLSTKTLIAPTITLKKNDGEVTVTIGVLDMSAGDTTLTLDNTTAAGVTVNGLVFGNGRTLTVTSANNDGMTGSGDITVSGKTAYNSPIAWNAENSKLSFDLNGIAVDLDNANSTNGPSLSTREAGVILGSATTLTVTGSEVLSTLDLGGAHTLIQKTSGAFTKALADQSSGAGKETYGFVANSSDTSGLYIFKNKFVVSGDHVINGPAVYTAGSGKD